MDEELERFKLDINLSEFAAAYGYRLDKRESWKGGAVMRHDNGDKIIVSRDVADQHWIYCSVRDTGDKGTIIDFLSNRGGGHLGRIRATLRSWSGSGPVPAESFARHIVPTEKDRGQVMAAFAGMEVAVAHPYLVHERKIPAGVLTSSRFAGQIRIDARGNAVFPHVDQSGLCGFELRNRNFQGFSKYGEKGLWFSRTFTGDGRLVFCEGAIDALSYHTLKRERATRYASIGGQVNPKQPTLIAAAIAKMPERAEIVAAMDSDEAGRKLAGLVEEAVHAAGRPDLVYRLDLPSKEGFDWNDVLKAFVAGDTAPSSYLPAANPEP